jgi:hypothetical protein
LLGQLRCSQLRCSCYRQLLPHKTMSCLLSASHLPLSQFDSIVLCFVNDRGGDECWCHVGLWKQDWLQPYTLHSWALCERGTIIILKIKL